MISRLRVALALMVAGVIVSAPPTAAQRSLREDPSVRSAGMGGASTAVSWSGDVNAWANPALLGYLTGLRYRWSTSQLLPDLASDVRFRANRFSGGWGGVGLSIENHTLDYGRVILTDSQGNPIGTFEPTERIRPLVGAVSLARVVETLATLRGVAVPSAARYGDVALGFSRKHITSNLILGERSTSNQSDFGLLVRASPMPRGDAGRPFVDLAYGYAALNHDDVEQLQGFIPSVFIPTQHRNGLMARVGLPLPTGTVASLERRLGTWIEPFVSVGVAADFTHFGSGPSDGPDVVQLGAEVEVANALAVRFGHVRDNGFGMNAYCFGFRIGLPLGDLAGVRYDYARYPQTSGLGMHNLHGLALWFDPVAVVRR